MPHSHVTLDKEWLQYLGPTVCKTELRAKIKMEKLFWELQGQVNEAKKKGSRGLERLRQCNAVSY